MLFSFVIIILAAIIIIALISRKKSSSSASEQKVEDYDFSEIKTFDEDFFKAVQNGEEAQLFLTLASQKDNLMIRSLLYADGIPSYTEGENMNNIYGGISGSMHAIVAIKIYILHKDFDRACEILDDYLKQTGLTVFPKE